ncbi:E3 ubiquitin/ISG15 ligase TRIM25 [Xenopus laevis]|uniref:Uncharacterized protein n=2 Tax=Xenopus laevis TaxID=8355 RepID=A0A974HV03_XENLA|nr:E3 ubiquitin/ISG15 ligase TRIM25 [Xenopus laevis]OCT91427.1 hypothetical protein XELAEV_18014481mg [Xenopus laevis]
MAAADLRVELTCSICQEIYTDPVSLPCGHNFCQGCIGKAWDWQKSIVEDPSCPQCRQRYRRQPELKRNLTLQNIAERFLPTDPEQDGTGISGDMKCSTHDKSLEYYCCEDGACVCVSCCLAGKHRGHRVELLSEASKKKKEKLRKALEKLRPDREETERGVQRLQDLRKDWLPISAVSATERITALFRDIREQLETLEKQLLSDISNQKEELSLKLSDLMEQLEIKKDELSSKICHIEELCNMANPLTVLQEQKFDAFCRAEGADNEGGRERDDIKDPSIVDLDEDLISKTLLTGLAGIVTGVEESIYGQKATDLVLNIKTAHNHVSVSGDRKSASYSHGPWGYPQSPRRFQHYPQALSSRVFRSGRHYWEVEVSESGYWEVGVAYLSIKRKGYQSGIGNSNRSWSLYMEDNNRYSVRHDNKYTDLPHVPSCGIIRISLDFEAGSLSFYELSEPIRHLCTFTAKFTEPLHAAFGVTGDNAWLRIII